VQSRVHTGECYPAARDFASFVASSRHLFGPERVKIADIALFYSVPHHLWIQDSSLSVAFDYRGIPSSDIIRCALQYDSIHQHDMHTISIPSA
jgi:hypothetical protein